MSLPLPPGMSTDGPFYNCGICRTLVIGSSTHTCNPLPPPTYKCKCGATLPQPGVCGSCEARRQRELAAEAARLKKLKDEADALAAELEKQKREAAETERKAREAELATAKAEERAAQAQREAEAAEAEARAAQERKEIELREGFAAVLQKELPSVVAAAAARAQETSCATVMTVGPTTAGKSTLNNASLHEKACKTGLASTTAEVATAGTLTTLNGVRMEFVDCPGEIADEALNLDRARVLAQQNVLIVIFDNSLHYVLDLIRTAVALKIPVVVVRNKLDIAAEDEEGWREVVAKDKADLAAAVGDHVGFFGISARNTYNARMAAQDAAAQEGSVVVAKDQYDWEAFFAHLQSMCEAIVKK